VRISSLRRGSGEKTLAQRSRLSLLDTAVAFWWKGDTLGVCHLVTNDFVPSLDGSVCGVVEVPSWAVEWCREVLDAVPVEQLHVSDWMTEVRAVRLDDGRAVVLTARVADDARRANGCVEVQRLLAEQGFPCPRRLSNVTVVGDRAVHAEEWRPGGEMIREDGREAATRSAWLLGDLMRRLEGIRADPPLPNPEWWRSPQKAA
jgi:hypothetical protein